MPAISLAKQAFSALNSEKPHSSITDWIEILTAHTVDDEAYDGIPELVDSINLQPTGPGEASRAIRKKLKHGDSHRQYRALVILKALVENGGPKFQTTFADGQLTDAIKLLAADPTLDPKVQRKLTMVLASWHQQFKTDPKMASVANLYKSTKDASGIILYEKSDRVKAQQTAQREQELLREQQRLEAKEKAKREKEEAKMRKAAQKQPDRRPNRQVRRVFDFEKEKPKVLSTIVEASQASNNLINALQLVNRDRESVQTNERVQECLAQLKQVRKLVVRYVQLVEDEQFIGTLIDTNERVIAALETYDNICGAEDDHEAPSTPSIGELEKLQSKQRSRVARSINRSKESLPPHLHPDLEELSFGNLGPSNQSLQPPIKPTEPDSPIDEYGRGSLSDYSDYDSSDEDEHMQRDSTGTSSSHKAYNHPQSEDEDDIRLDSRKGLLDPNDDPFADPFADQEGVETPGIVDRKGMNWRD